MNLTRFQYQDREGTLIGTMTNDGTEIRVTLDDWEFFGSMFDDLEPVRKEDLPERFRLVQGTLCDCEYRFVLPVSIEDQGQVISAELHVHCELGKADDRGGIDHEAFHVSLEYAEELFVSSGNSGGMEDELLELQKQLPEHVYLKACINCLYSDYSPYGSGAFGCMMCFRNLKQEYLQVKSKDDFWAVHDRFERQVQETWLCKEFQRRIPGTGYRG